MWTTGACPQAALHMSDHPLHVLTEHPTYVQHGDRSSPALTRRHLRPANPPRQTRPHLPRTPCTIGMSVSSVRSLPLTSWLSDDRRSANSGRSARLLPTLRHALGRRAERPSAQVVRMMATIVFCNSRASSASRGRDGQGPQRHHGAGRLGVPGGVHSQFAAVLSIAASFWPRNPARMGSSAATTRLKTSCWASGGGFGHWPYVTRVNLATCRTSACPLSTGLLSAQPPRTGRGQDATNFATGRALPFTSRVRLLWP